MLFLNESMSRAKIMRGNNENRCGIIHIQVNVVFVSAFLYGADLVIMQFLAHKHGFYLPGSSSIENEVDRL